MIERWDNAGQGNGAKSRMDMIPQGATEGQMLMDGMQAMASVIEQETDHWLLQFNAEKLAGLGRIDSVVIVGPSGAGKSTAVDAARTWTQSEGVSGNFFVPQRVVSRPPRLNDNLVENRFASTPQEFEEMTRGGIQWDRKMDLEAAGRIEHYGFGPVPENAIPIYSANNAFLAPDAHLSGVAPDFNEHALVMCVYAFPHIRAERLTKRSPDIMTKKPEEAAMRLAPMPEYVSERSHITMRTRDVEKERPLSAEAMLVMLRTIAKIKKTERQEGAH